MLHFFLWLLRLIYFRKVTAVGFGPLAEEGPLLVVANHVNGLLDPLLLYVHLPRRPRFLAKAPLFRNPFVAPFLKAARALPVARAKDGPGGSEQNQATFDACVHALLDGEAVALFPEGISHGEPKIQPLKTGAARIAGLSRAKGASTKVVPVGLVYSAASVFRSEAILVAGPPVPYGDLEWLAGDNPEAVRALTGRMAEALSRVTVNADRWRDLEIVEALRGIAIERMAPEERTNISEPDTRLEMERFYAAKLSRPLEMARLVKSARRYIAMLGALGIREGDAQGGEAGLKSFDNALRGFAALAAGMAPALYGWLFHVVPYTLTGLTAKWMASSIDVLSTYKIYAGLLFYPLFYLLELGLAFQALGPWPALAIGLTAVPAGFWAVRYSEKREAYVRAAWAVLLLKTRRNAAHRLAAARSEASNLLEPFLDIYR